MTECTQTSFTFADHSHRQVVARFDGGTITSDGGGVLLRQLEQRTGIVRRFGFGKSTLNRLELTPAKAGAASRYKKQEGRFFHGC